MLFICVTLAKYLGIFTVNGIPELLLAMEDKSLKKLSTLRVLMAL